MKTFLIGLVFILISSISVNANAEEIVGKNTSINIVIENIINELLEKQFDSLVTGKAAEINNYFTESESSALYMEFIRWRTEQATHVDTLWSEYVYSLSINNIKQQENKVIVEGTLDLDYTLKNGLKLSQHDIILSLSFFQENNDYKINDIYMNESMFEDFSRNITDYLNKVNKSRSESGAISKAADLWLNDIEKMQELNTQNDTELENENSLARASYNYSSGTAVTYANTYYANGNSSFYNAGADCTNFVSQCVWAGYGGTSGNVASNISNKVRMTGEWYAGSGGGSSAWESVNGFWDYTTKSKNTGPAGSGSNNNKVYSNIVTFGISVGNVLQVRTASTSDYKHSVFVIENNAGSSSAYGNIVVAQHTSNTKRSLADLISSWGGANCYMRKIHFSSANFDK